MTPDKTVMERLLPCPWCGDEGICDTTIMDAPEMGWHVSCNTDLCPGNIATPNRSYRTRKEAEEAWNRRAPSAHVEQSAGEGRAESPEHWRYVEFFQKYALGSKLPPSCLCCGQTWTHEDREGGVHHAELPGIFVCKKCKAATSPAEALAGQWPRASSADADGGWILAPKFLEQIQEVALSLKEENVSLEGVEAVLVALDTISPAIRQSGQWVPKEPTPALQPQLLHVTKPQLLK